jgi:hypothetical protein
MAGARRAGLLLMEAERICAACQQSGATAHLTPHSQTALQRLLDADEGEIALLAWHVRVAPALLLVLKRAER